MVKNCFLQVMFAVAITLYVASFDAIKFFGDKWGYIGLIVSSLYIITFVMVNAEYFAKALIKGMSRRRRESNGSSFVKR